MELEREWEERAYPLTGKGNRGEPIEKKVMNKEVVVVDLETGEEESEVQKLTEELMAFENFMKFYQIPYLDGQSTAPNGTQESLVGNLWSFFDDGVDAPVTSAPL